MNSATLANIMIDTLSADAQIAKARRRCAALGVTLEPIAIVATPCAMMRQHNRARCKATVAYFVACEAKNVTQGLSPLSLRDYGF